MRANTDRSLALSFDSVAELYDSVRPRFSAKMIGSLIERCGMTAEAATVLEIGAGTGQLTDALLSLGCSVTAVEPGATMAAMLSDRATVINDTFETATLNSDQFDLVTSANAFHWVDPGVGHAKVARLLRPGGALLLLWNFPLPVDEADQSVINSIVVESMPDSVVVRDEVLAHIESALVDGRTEIEASGALQIVDWGWEVDRLSMSPLHRLRLSASYASTVGIDEGLLIQLAEQIEQQGVLACEVENRIYWLIARPCS